MEIYKYIIMTVLLVVTLLVGFLVGYVSHVPEVTVCEVCEVTVCETCESCEDQIITKPKRYVSQTELRRAIEKQLEDIESEIESESRKVTILTTSLPCWKLIESETNKGYMDETEVPFCWNRNGRVEFEVLSINDQNGGCQLAISRDC